MIPEGRSATHTSWSMSGSAREAPNTKARVAIKSAGKALMIDCCCSCYWIRKKMQRDGELERVKEGTIKKD